MAASAAGSGDGPPSRPRPRPGPPRAPAQVAHHHEPAEPAHTPGRELAVPESQSTQMVVAAGSAIVTAARVGRLFGRVGLRAARQLPGVAKVEQQGRRLRTAAAAELVKLLDAPRVTGPSHEEQRAAMLAHQGANDPAPLRSAMTELLDRSTAASGAQSRDYLFGTIVSQLVPDEARILAALGTGRTFAAVDVVAKGRSGTRTVLANVSSVGAAAGVSLPDNVSTYLTRLDSYGLIEFGRAADDLGAQYRSLETDKRVRATQESIDRTRQGSAKIVRKSVTLSDLGREFWVACAPGGGAGRDRRRS